MIQNINTVFTLFIIVMCLVFAYFAAFTSLFDDKMQGTPRIIFITLMISYSIFRSYRLYKAYQHNKKQNQD